MIKRRRYYYGALLSLCLAHSAQAGLFDDTEARAQIGEVRQQLQQQQSQQQQQLNERFQQQDRRFLDVASQIQQLQEQIAQVRGQLEVLQNSVEGVQKRQKESYTDIDSRLRRLEENGAGSSKNSTPNTTSPAMTSAESSVDSKPPSGDEVKLYEAALTLLNQGNAKAAIGAWQDFLVLYPKSRLLPNTLYWLGSAYVTQKDSKNALTQWQRLVTDFPKSDKAADGWLSLANLQQELGDKTAAKKSVEQLLSQYPKSAAAEKAKRRWAK